MSDTHGYVDPKVYHHFKDVDEIWHAGDIGSLEVIDELKEFKPLKIVHGNIDSNEIRQEAPEYLFFEEQGVKFLITHIGGKPGKYYRRANELIDQLHPEVFICGHSHILLVQQDKYKNMLWLNPGACGYKGFHAVKTLLRFQIENGAIKNMEAIEIGKRV